MDSPLVVEKFDELDQPTYDFSVTNGSECTSENALYNTTNSEMYDPKISPSKKTVKFSDIVEEVGSFPRSNLPLKKLIDFKKSHYDSDENNEKGSYKIQYRGEDVDKKIDNNHKVNNTDNTNSKSINNVNGFLHKPSYNFNYYDIEKSVSVPVDKNLQFSVGVNDPVCFHLNQSNHNNSPRCSCDDAPAACLNEKEFNPNFNFKDEKIKFVKSNDIINDTGKKVADSSMVPTNYCGVVSSTLDSSNPALKESANMASKSYKKKLFNGKKVLMLENEKKQLEIENLTICIEAQQSLLENYQIMINNLENDFQNLKKSHRSIVSDNERLNENLVTIINALDKATTQLDVLTKIKQSDQEEPVTRNLKNAHTSLSSYQNFDKLTKLFQDMQFKNQYLQEVCIFLIRKINNLYRYSIAPALFLVRDRNLESTDNSLSFDSKDSVQSFIDCNSYVFKNLQELSIITEITNVDNYKHKQENVFNGLEMFFEQLNKKISQQLEIIIRQTLCS
jgi:hypothetical protein